MFQDFTGKNLQGRSFKGRNLAGANFSRTTIRGADFMGANLEGANFSHAVAGVQPRWAVILVAISFLISTCSGGFVGIASILATYPLIWGFSQQFEFILAIPFSELTKIFPVAPVFFIVTFFLLFAQFCSATIRKGLEPASRVLIQTTILIPASVISIFVLSPVLWVALKLGAIFGLGSMIESFAVGLLIASFPAIAGIILAAITGALVWCIVVMLGVAVGVTEALAGVGAVALFLARIMTAISVVIGAWEKVPSMSEIGLVAWIEVVVVAVVVACFVASISGYVSWQAFRENNKYARIHSSTVVFAALGGTNFESANLTDANFTRATLKSTNFRRAKMMRTDWFNCRQLSLAIVENTYLQDAKIQKLAIAKNGQNQNFDGTNLQGINLQGANLVAVSFIGANLDRTNLQQADLSRANLARSQLEAADLTSATLTGANIEDWKITRSTKLEGIIADYVYMREGNRMPHQGTFKPGEFRTFIRFFLYTLDLYHDGDVNPQAAISALQHLSQNYRESLEIVAVDNRGDRTILKLKTSETINHVLLKNNYLDLYHKLLLENDKPSELLALTDHTKAVDFFTQILAETKQQQSTVYLWNSGIHLKGDRIVLTIDQSRSQTIDTQGESLNISEPNAFNLGNISGTVAKTINQSHDAKEENKNR